MGNEKSLLFDTAAYLDLMDSNQSPTSDNWIAAPGLGSQAKCEASIKEKLDLWKQFKDSKFEKNTVVFTNNNSSMTYVCLPEAEDPRNKPAKAPKPAK